jgi:propionyl-CoA synthetase
MPGYQVDVVDEAAKPLPAGTMGSIVIKLPLPPGCLPTLWEQDERCREAYFNEFPGYYKTSDAGYKDEDGYVFVMGRTDDIINVAGHRFPPAAWRDPGLASRRRRMRGARRQDAIRAVPCGFLVLKAGVTAQPCRDRKRDRGAGARNSVPWRRSNSRDHRGPAANALGKILRGTIKKIADGDQWAIPATIEDPKVLDEIGDAEGEGVSRDRHSGRSQRVRASAAMTGSASNPGSKDS